MRYLRENDNRHKSKYELRKRENANGVKPSGQQKCSNRKEITVNKKFINKQLIISIFIRKHSLSALMFQEAMKETGHSILYTLSRNEAVIVKYTPDEKTDMFQVL